MQLFCHHVHFYVDKGQLFRVSEDNQLVYLFHKFKPSYLNIIVVQYLLEIEFLLTPMVKISILISWVSSRF